MRLQMDVYMRMRTCKTSRSSATFRQPNTLGAMAAKKPSPRPVSGEPRPMVPISSRADDGTHGSSALAFAIEAVSRGSAYLTVVSYTAGAFAVTTAYKTSLRTDKKIGSIVRMRVSDCVGKPIKPTLDILRPDIQKGSSKSFGQIRREPRAVGDS